MDSLHEFLTNPKSRVEEVLRDDTVKEDIDQELMDRSVNITVKKDFDPVVEMVPFDIKTNFERYCRANCLENEILIHPR